MSKKRNRSKPWPVFFAMFAAALVGSYLPRDASIFHIPIYDIFEILGTLFLNALTIVVVPLVSSSIITGVAKIGSEGTFGRLGGKMFFFYLSTSLVAVLIGLIFINVINPGHFETPPTSILETKAIQLSDLKEQVKGSANFSSLLTQMVPSNILLAFSQGNMLALILFSLLFGYCISKIDSHPSSTLQSFFQGIFQAMIRFTQYVMKLLPIGVFCLVAKVFMNSEPFSSLRSVALFLVTVLLALSTFMFVGLPLLLKFVAKVSPMRHFKAMYPALITAFSTSSSSATLPVTIECVEKRAGVSNRICSLVVPLGTSINMSGSALYECVAAMFVAQAYGIELSFGTQFVFVFMALITSIGVAGIPSASLIAVMMILNFMGLPVEGLSLFIAVDRLLDMCRTTVNVFSDSCCAILVARSEGEKGVLATDPMNIPL